jgi:hypothetical protein
MIEINGKEYKINTDIEWGTEKLMKKVLDDPENPKNQKYLEYIITDLLVPTPTIKEMFHFRKSDILKIFKSFSEKMSETDKDFKKKLSQ